MAVILDKGLTVLDFDSTAGYEEWYAGYGHGIDTFTVRTGRGYHVYLKLLDPLQSTAKMPGGDIKATGYVVAPDSEHANGNAYTIIHDCPVHVIPNIETAGVQVLELVNPMQFDEPLRKYEGGEGIVAKINRYLNVRELLQMYGVQIRRHGYQHVANCPFHDDRHPSLGVYSESVYCFTTGCKAHRYIDALGLFALLNNIDVRTAIKLLAKQV